jgi:ABC-type microcin C transport system duplicated ATPase subunit YejF
LFGVFSQAASSSGWALRGSSTTGTIHFHARPAAQAFARSRRSRCHRFSVLLDFAAGWATQLCCARAAACRPAFASMDESTSALDVDLEVSLYLSCFCQSDCPCQSNCCLFLLFICGQAQCMRACVAHKIAMISVAHRYCRLIPSSWLLIFGCAAADSSYAPC